MRKKNVKIAISSEPSTENVDSFKKAQTVEVNKIIFLCGRSVNYYYISNEDFVGGGPFEDAGKDDHMTSCLPKINLEIKT